ncbi:MAG TPA: kelch repeat-containing protein [Polyangiaceae bacterium]|nr:kelch repeat-containing protein [Polyangiaceae bacterium]
MRLLAGLLVPTLLLACSSSPEPAAQTAPSAEAGASDPPPGGAPVCAGSPKGSTLPTPRGDAAGALSADGKTLVLFGGDTAVAPCGSVAAAAHDGGSFVLDVGCGDFTPVDQAPPARARHVVLSDRARDRALLFGGRTRKGGSGPYTLFADVWAFDFAKRAWSELPTKGTAPSPRANLAAAVDEARGELVVFGGNTSTDGLAFAPQNDTFVLDLATSTWRTLDTPARPPARLFHAMALDSAQHVAWVISGGDKNAFVGPFLRDVWKLDLAASTWTKVETSGEAPLGLINHAAMFDAVGKRVVVFGGHDDGQVGNQNEIYTLDVATGAWARLPLGDALNKPSTKACVFAPDFTTIDKASPERRSAFVFAPRPDGQGFFAGFGKSDCGLLGDSHWFSLPARRWSPVRTSPVGLSCLRAQETCAGLCG